MDIVRKINYRRPMGPEDVEKMSQLAGEYGEDLNEMREDLKVTLADARAEIKATETKLAEMLDCLRIKRFPEAPLLVREQYDKPVAGKKTVTVAETGEVLEVLDMTDEEKESLFRDRSGSEGEPSDNVLDREAMAGK